MIYSHKIIRVTPGSELDRVLEEATEAPIEVEKSGVRYRVMRVDTPPSGNPLTLADSHDIWAGYDPERALAGMRAAAGSWSDLDAEALKAALYRAREEGTRPTHRP